MLNNSTTVGDLKKLISHPEFQAIRDRMRAVILRRQGESLRKIGAILSRPCSYVERWNNRFKQEGATGLLTRKVEKKSFLSPKMKRNLLYKES